MEKTSLNAVNRYIKRLVICFIIVFGVILIFALTGCSSRDKKKFWEKYGKDKAYNKSEHSVLLNAPDTFAYYIDSSVSGNYLTAVKYAISKANSLTGNVKVSTTTDSGSNFVIKVANMGKNGMNAINEYYFLPDTGEIIESIITLNAYYMKNFSLDDIKHVALHEIGHTFGLIDLKNSAVKPYSIMYYRSSSYNFVEYQEFDVANITWYYGE